MSGMPRKTLVLALLALGVLCWALLPADTPGPAATPAVAADQQPPSIAEYRVSGPFTHDNLTVFLLHGPDTLPPRPILTLDEALAKNSFVVHETGDPNRLTVENLSGDDDVLIQPGDIVRGGRQDRLIASALLVPANSGKIAVPSFCVERHRWQQRGQEDAAKFAENRACIAGKDLKQAALVAGEQVKVWDNVSKLQNKLSENVGQKVNCPDSPTSLQLALENRAVNDRLRGYEDALGGVLRGSRSAVGYVIAVNGKVTGAEVFGSSAVLAKAWPKALRSAAVEALAERTGQPCEPPTCGQAMAFLLDAERGQADRPQVAQAGGRGRGREVQGPEEFIADGWADVAGEVNRSPRQADNAEPAPRQQPAGYRPAMGGFEGDAVVNRRTGARGGNEQAELRAAAVQVNRVKGKQGVLVESRDARHPAMVVHRSFVAW